MEIKITARNTELTKQDREDIKTLSAMADATLTIQALDEVARQAKEIGLFYFIGNAVGRNNSRLQGKVNFRPSIYVNKENGTTVMVSGGKVVGSPYTTTHNICEQGYKFQRVVE